MYIVTGASIHAPRHRNSLYGHTVYIREQMTQTPSLANTPARMMPPGNRSTALLYRTLPGSTLRLRPGISSDVTITARTPPLCQDTTHWHIRYPTISLLSALAVLCWAQFWTQIDSPFPTWFDSPFLTWADSLFPTCSDSQFLTGFDSVSPRFDLTHV